MPRPTQLRIDCNVLVVSGPSEQVDRARWVSVSEVPNRNRIPTTDNGQSALLSSRHRRKLVDEPERGQPTGKSRRWHKGNSWRMS